MHFLFDIIVSSPPPEPPVTWGSAWRLLVALPVGFLVLLAIFWAGIALAGYLKRHASRVKSNLGASPAEDDDAVKGAEQPPKES